MQAQSDRVGARKSDKLTGGSELGAPSEVAHAQPHLCAFVLHETREKHASLLVFAKTYDKVTYWHKLTQR